MSSSRMHNYGGAASPDPGPPPPPPAPVPAGATAIKTITGLDATIYCLWTYTGADASTIDHFTVNTTLGAAVISTVIVLEPDTDVEIPGLVNGSKYGVTVTPHNKGGDGKPSAPLTATPVAPVLPAPVMTALTPGDDLANVTWTLAALPEGYTLDWVSYEGTRTDTKETVTEHVNGMGGSGTCALNNDVEWSVALVAVASKNGNQTLSAFSNVLKVHPTKPIAPYRPDILDAYATEGGVLVVKWAPEDQPPAGNTGPLDIDMWRVRVQSSDGKGTDFSEDIAGAARTWADHKLTMGYWSVYVSAHNDVGWSVESKPAVVFYSYAYKPALTGGGTTWDDLDYYYLYAKADTKLTRTPEGANTPIRAAMVGAGGAGHRQTLTLAKGGDGGGGELVIMDLPIPGKSGEIVVTVGGGATENNGDTPAVTSITENKELYIARPGKSATGKDDGQGYGPVPVPETWKKLSAFAWNGPWSWTVGGVTNESTPQYPNGYGPGQAGAGSKTGRAGNGEDGIIVFRWRKDGKPDPEPTLGEGIRGRKRWWNK